MKSNRLALAALLFLTAVTLVFVSAHAIEKRPPYSAVQSRKIERIFTKRPRITP